MTGRLSVKDGKRALLGFSHTPGDQQLMLIKTVSDPDPMESLCHGAQVNPPTPTFSALDMAMMSVEIFTVSLNKPLWESYMPPSWTVWMAMSDLTKTKMISDFVCQPGLH